MERRAAGLNIPLFSLRSKSGCGVGEFNDLISLIDWAKKAGLKIIQLLPINDTSMSETDSDSYPYSILSAFALHPIYIHLQELAPDLKEEIDDAAHELNRPTLHYEDVYQTKKAFLKMIFQMRGEKDLASKEFQQFFKRHQESLKPYAAFCFLRERHQTTNFRKWGKDGKYSPILAEMICQEEDVSFYYFTQYHLHRQLKQAVSYAKKQGILLKGDFPMGVDPNSVEAWRFPDYFRWHMSMGAPPDFYNKHGQNWGFPPYDWEEIKEEGFYYLKTRLKWMEQYFSIVRLDHVLGYFRLWEIPVTEVRGLMGTFFPAIGYTEEELKLAGLTDIKRLITPYKADLPKKFKNEAEAKKKGYEEYYPFLENVLFFKDQNGNGTYHPRIDVASTGSFKALPSETQTIVQELFEDYYLKRQDPLWEKKGLEKLKVMQRATKMKICAEDIGVVPTCVGKVLKELKIPSLCVQRMPTNFEIDFEDPSKFPRQCVCTPSNHDTATLREWWEEDLQKTSKYYHEMLKKLGNPPKQLTQELAIEIIQAHLNSKALYAIFLLQDLFAMSDTVKFPHPKLERINDPGDPEFEWNWRMHLYLEELHLAQSFTKKIKSMVKEGKR